MNKFKKKISLIWSKMLQNKWQMIRLATVLLLLIAFGFSLLIFLKYAWKIEITEQITNSRNTKIQVEKLNEITEILNNKESNSDIETLPIFKSPFRAPIQAQQQEVAPQRRINNNF